MEALLAAAVVAALVVPVALVVRRRRTRRRVAHAADEMLDPADLADLEARFGQADAEERARHDSLLCARLDLLIARGVPVRRIQPAAAHGAVTVGFADGTAITVASRRPADAGVLVLYASNERVVLGGYRREDARLLLRFRRPGRSGHVEVVALGFDQPV